MAIIVTNSVCWSRFEKATMGRYSTAALSWMFRKSRIPWNLLLQISVAVILKKYGITEGCLGVDETDKKRSKRTKKIFRTHKVFDKSSGGYFNGQSIVFLLLITKSITIPVGFSFYKPDPVLSAWRKKDKKLKKKGVAKKYRPAEPARNPNYPTKSKLALNLFEQFKKAHGDIRIRCIFADALYGTEEFVDQASALFGGIQVISQIHCDQVVRFRNKEISAQEYFTSYPGTKQKIQIRGSAPVEATVGSARLYVQAHRKKRFVIALKYEGEDEYRYIIASDLSWRTIDIVQAYTLRWLVEIDHTDYIYKIDSCRTVSSLTFSLSESCGFVCRKQPHIRLMYQ